jgi:hypothetical protein
MPEKNFLKEVIYPLLLRFVAAVIVTIAISLGLALMVHALEEEQTTDKQTREIKEIKPVDSTIKIPETQPDPPVQVVHYTE